MSDWVAVCPTRKRADVICEKTAKFFPNIIYAMDAEDKKDYIEKAGMSANQIMVVESKGITNVMHEIMEKRPERTVVRVDDDLKSVRCIVGQRARSYTEEEDLLGILEQGKEVSNDLGYSLWHYGYLRNPMYYLPQEPFQMFRGIAAQIYGIHDRKLVYDRNMIVHEDMDITMQAYLKDRVAWHDNRFIWQFGRPNEGAGGLQGQRTEEREMLAFGEMVKKWGQFILNKNHDGWAFNFQRKNALASMR